MRPDAATLRLAVLPRAGLLTDAVLVLGGAVFVAAAAQIVIPLPFTPVPISAVTFAVLLVGASYGAARGGITLAFYLLLGLLGASVFAPGETEGLARILGPTGGYLLSYPLVAWLTGRLAERRWDRRFRSAALAMLAGSALIYAIGLPWLAVALGTGLRETLALGLLPFIPGDLLKLALAGAALPGAWRLVRGASE
ncbi:MAG: biotin transporter BioY [Thermoleophilaceae bacterium]|nr:biotin transporter BioY [Thermoleophilaceae bacterium]